jgi:hypothetical protein
LESSCGVLDCSSLGGLGAEVEVSDLGGSEGFIVARSMQNPAMLEPEHPPQYLDLSEYPDFETMQNRVAGTHEFITGFVTRVTQRLH